MKKIISIILSLALVVCMFGMNVSAANEIGTVNDNKGQIGSYGGNNGIDNGKDTFNPTDFEQAVTLKLGAVESRYAVDIVFGGASSYQLNVSGLVWNVNELKYVVGENAETVSDSLSYTFVVTNYSDKAIKVEASGTLHSDVNGTGLGLTFADSVECAEGDFTEANYADESVSGVLARNESGTSINDVKKVAFSASIASTAWADDINTLVEKHGADTINLATFTVTVSKVS